MRVLAAMSGGVDSAVAAGRALDAGHEVTGVHLALSPSPKALREGARGCCTLEDARDARRAADVLGIPFYVWDLAERFRADVVDDFVAEYAAGRTPNPCLRCNERIKFAAVLDRARGLGFDAVCTGHYARLVDHPDGARTLHRATDGAKDQSYVLGSLTPDQLSGAMFPLGSSSKTQVRVEAAQRGLAVAEKPDSHDVCFIPDGDTAGWLRDRIGSAPGEVHDVDGAILGRHDGAFAFTIGQRRGLALDRPAPDGRPRYVLSISPVERRVTVGPAAALAINRIEGDDLRWLGAPHIGRCAAQVRAHGSPIGCLVSSSDDGRRLRVVLDESIAGVAPGQAVVLYDGDRVLGAATVSGTEQATEGCAREPNAGGQDDPKTVPGVGRR